MASTLTEAEWVKLFDDHDALVQSCIAGVLSFSEFLDRYDSFPDQYALDGHEADEREREILDRHSERAKFHLGLSETLGNLCREEDAGKPEYRRAGRFGPIEGLARLRQYVQQNSHWQK